MHNPNPFDFVPFAGHPHLKTPEEFDALGPAVSGYLEVKLRALTPVHIVGYQEPGAKEGYSFLYRQDDRPCIPAASLRGCLRAFLEALTSGWVSQATPEYPKLYHKRHIGFRTFESFPNRGRSMNRTSPPAVNPEFKPSIRSDNRIDVVSYLLGMVIEPEGGQVAHEALARKAKVWIEDAFIDQQHLVKQKYWVPDIKHATQDAFMGGAKASASNWWYLQPAEIWRRNVRTRAGYSILAEFVGEKFWGRKFYFHQDPQRCMQFYHPNSSNWRYSPDRPFYPIQLECLEKEASTETFRIYLDKVPQPLAILLAVCLFPGLNIRHKLGYGKSYGYGSVELSLQSSHLRYDETRPPDLLQDFSAKLRDWMSLAWDQSKLAASGLPTAMLDWQALSHLARILGWQEADKLLFTYPPFAKRNFMQPVTFEEMQDNAPAGVRVDGHVKVNAQQGRAFAENLFEIKQPIHFRVYQERAKGWSQILRRLP